MIFRQSDSSPSAGATETAEPRRQRSRPVHSHEPRLARQFGRLTDNIVREFPPEVGGTILFTGLGSNRHVAEVAEEVARQLAFHLETSSVALVDGNADTPILTERLAGAQKVGLAEILQQRTTVASTLFDTGMRGVRFLPFGDRREARNPVTSQAVKSAFSDLRQLCRYTVVTIGAGQTKLHARLSRHSDGTYLIVQLGAANYQDMAKTTRYLNRAGARLLGCVATSAI
ncbi:MAG: hypothetical protein ACQESR_09360 [Planctomycetota bacterium]